MTKVYCKINGELAIFDVDTNIVNIAIQAVKDTLVVNNPSVLVCLK